MEYFYGNLSGWEAESLDREIEKIIAEAKRRGAEEVFALNRRFIADAIAQGCVVHLGVDGGLYKTKPAEAGEKCLHGWPKSETRRCDDCDPA